MTLPIDFTGQFVDLSGGFNTDASTYTILDKESPELQNVRPQPLGPIAGRYGTKLVSSASGYAHSVSNAHIIGLHRYYKQKASAGGSTEDYVIGIASDGTTPLLFRTDVTDFTQYIEIGTTGTGTPPGTPWGSVVDANEASTLNSWQFVTFKDWVFFTADNCKLWRTNGTYVKLVGERPAPNGAVTFTPQTSGGSMADGTYYYTFTDIHRDGLGESPEYQSSGARIAVTVSGGGGSGSVDFDIAAPVDSQNDIVERRVYRTTAVGGEDGRAYLVFVQSDNAAISGETDTLADASIPIAGVPAYTSQTRAEPPRGACLEAHQNRLWLGRLRDFETGTTTLRKTEVAFSNALKPEEWEVDFAINFENASGEAVNAIASHSNVLLVFGSTRVSAVTGVGIETGSISIPDFRAVELGVGPGAFGPAVVQRRNGRLYTMNKDDVWQFEGLRAKPISEFRIRDWIEQTVDQGEAFTATAIRTQSQYRVSFPAVGAGGHNNTTLIYDSQSRSFYKDTGYWVKDYIYTPSADDDRALYSCSDQAGLLKGFVVQHDTGNTDFAAVPTDLAGTEQVSNVVRQFRTKDFALGRWAADTCQFLLLIVGASIAGKTMAVKMRINQEREETVRTIDLETGDSRWNEVNWDEFVWAFETLKLHRISLPQSAVGTTIGFLFTQDEAEAPFEIQMFAISGQYLGIEAEPS